MGRIHHFGQLGGSRGLVGLENSGVLAIACPLACTLARPVLYLPPFLILGVHLGEPEGGAVPQKEAVRLNVQGGGFGTQTLASALKKGPERTGYPLNAWADLAGLKGISCKHLRKPEKKGSGKAASRPCPCAGLNRILRG